jgi:hypothetical protein
VKSKKRYDRLPECPKKTPLYVGVFVHLLIFYSLCGGYKSARLKFIPVYMIYATLDRSDCGYEVKIGNGAYPIKSHNRLLQLVALAYKCFGSVDIRSLG